jgi:hypothetical protein
MSRGRVSLRKSGTLVLLLYMRVADAMARKFWRVRRTLDAMRRIAKESPARRAPVRSTLSTRSDRSTGHRIIPAALASVGFLVTFTVRSWQQDLWSPRQASYNAAVSVTQQHAAARWTPNVGGPVESPPPLASVLRQEAVRLRTIPTATAPSAGMPAAAAAAYLAERDRETRHDGRLR